MTLSRQPALRCLGGLLLAAGSASALSQAHVHGEAVLEIVIEPGKLWSWENFGIVPDVFVFGKAITNGLNPLSGIWAKEDRKSVV